TDVSGMATSAVFTSNAVAGNYSIVATAGSVAGDFSLTNQAGAAANILVTNGSLQSTTVRTPFPAPLSALVTDANNNPVGGINVTFAAPSGGASVAFSGGLNTATTDGTGVASVAVTANGIAGNYAIVAYVGPVLSANFTLTNRAGPAAFVSAVAGTG